jgi:hypothetical protein
VVLDYQPMGTEQHAYNVDKFVAGWEKLWKMMACAPNFNSDMAGGCHAGACRASDRVFRNHNALVLGIGCRQGVSCMRVRVCASLQ